MENRNLMANSANLVVVVIEIRERIKRTVIEMLS